jgi:hypothetical protein
MNYTEIGNGCWAWSGSFDASGYAVTEGGDLAWTEVWQSHRDVPPPAVARPVCGNRSCVNPDHWIEVSGSTSEARFWEFVRHWKEHWVWQGAFVRGKYPYFWNGVKAEPAYRFAWRLVNDGAEPGVLHRVCREPRCVNPAHFIDKGGTKPSQEELSLQLRGQHLNASTVQALSREAVERLWPYMSQEVRDSYTEFLERRAAQAPIFIKRFEEEGPSCFDFVNRATTEAMIPRFEGEVLEAAKRHLADLDT